MLLGPVQLLVVGFADDQQHAELRAELDRLRTCDAIRVIDLLQVRRAENPRADRLEVVDPSVDEQFELGVLVRRLIGMTGDRFERSPAAAQTSRWRGLDAERLGRITRYVDVRIPPGSAATIVLIEHRWAIGLRSQIRDGGGSLLTDGWVHPSDLARVGLVFSEYAEREMLFDAAPLI